MSQVPILRVFGVNDRGNSVCAFVHGFEPYFYIPAPTASFGPSECEALRRLLDDKVREAQKRARGTLVTRIVPETKCSVWYYQKSLDRPFLKVVVATPNLVAPCRTALERGVTVPGLGLQSFTTYESNVLYALRFMIDCGITGCNWVELPGGKYRLRGHDQKITHCQIEADILFRWVRG